jgi:hypothetical protein
MGVVDETDRTDTWSELQDDLVQRAAERNRRIHIGAAGVLAAAVVLASAVALRADDVDPAGPSSGVAPPRSSAPMNVDEQLAHDFVSAWFAHDRPRATSYVAPDATAYAVLGATTTPRQATGPGTLWRRNRLDEALGNELSVDGCWEIGAPSAETSRIGCLFTVDLLGLGELGRGPFPDNLFLVTVEDGEVVSFFTAIGANDYDEEGWGPFLAWVEDGRGPDLPDLDRLDDPDLAPREVGRTIRSWGRAGRDYVTALRSGEAT